MANWLLNIQFILLQWCKKSQCTYVYFNQVFQRRMNGKVDFYRSWKEYKYGFGNVSEEHWIGMHN